VGHALRRGHAGELASCRVHRLFGGECGFLVAVGQFPHGWLAADSALFGQGVVDQVEGLRQCLLDGGAARRLGMGGQRRGR
jgi:hypothetical protein